MSAACRSCGAPIFWAITEKGRRAPIDASPSPDGNLVLRKQTHDDGVEVLDEPMLALSVTAAEKAATLWEPLDPAEPRFLSHFVTCLQADQWRSK